MALDLNLSLSLPNYPTYKAEFSLLTRNGERYVGLDRMVLAHIRQELRREWTLVDPKGKIHKVVYQKGWKHSFLTDGWMQIRRYYGLIGTHVIKFMFVGDSFFDIKIYDALNHEIGYVMACQRAIVAPPLLSAGSSLFIWQFDHNMTERQANRGTDLNIPKRISRYLPESYEGIWTVFGPRAGEMKCRVLLHHAKGYAKIGKGWSDFIRYNSIRGGDLLVVKFTNKLLRIIVVDIHRANV